MELKKIFAYPLVIIELEMYDKCLYRTDIAPLRVTLKSDELVELVRKNGILTSEKEAVLVAKQEMLVCKL